MARLLRKARRHAIDPRDDFPARMSSVFRRQQRRREKHQQMAEALRSLGHLPSGLEDWSDCRHGCNGDCERWGGERCDFTCHDVRWRHDEPGPG
jgi:hypothetical protein